MATGYTLDLNVPIETAFEYVDDPAKQKLWMDDVEATIFPPDHDATHPLGTTFKQQIREGGRVSEYDGEVVAYDKPNHLAVHVGNQQFTVRVDYRFTPTLTGTRLDYSVDMVKASAIMRLFTLLFAWFNNRTLDKQMKKFKAVVEGRQAVPG